MLVHPAALLCLDEPTNHLDLAAREVLEHALAEFGGTIVFISHDRYFINRIATKVIEVSNGRLTVHLGNYDDYLARREAPPAMTSPARPTPNRPPGSGSARRRGDGGAARLARELKKLRERLSAVEGEIASHEARLADLARLLADPELYRDGERAREIAGTRKETEEQMARLMREWEEISGRMGDGEAPG
jgi:ATP-binding cassette subfamily F protein 3